MTYANNIYLSQMSDSEVSYSHSYISNDSEHLISKHSQPLTNDRSDIISRLSQREFGSQSSDYNSALELVESKENLDIQQNKKSEPNVDNRPSESEVISQDLVKNSNKTDLNKENVVLSHNQTTEVISVTNQENAVYEIKSEVKVPKKKSWPEILTKSRHSESRNSFKAHDPERMKFRRGKYEAIMKI